MEVVALKTRKWGNSLGMIIPNPIVQHGKMKPNQTVRILLLPGSQKALTTSFGMLKDRKIDAQKMKDRLRRDLYD